MSKPKITNTARDFFVGPRGNENSSVALLEAMALGDRYFEHQELRGQEELKSADVLPVSGIAQVEAIGVEVIGPVDGDDLFVYVKLPDGWSKRATDHSMWTDLVDGEGRPRAEIFYKAAFYDRKAHVYSCSRYSTGIEFENIGADNSRVRGTVLDVKDVVHRTDWLPPEEVGGRVWPASEEARKRAVAWLDEHRPSWKDKGAYW